MIDLGSAAAQAAQSLARPEAATPTPPAPAPEDQVARLEAALQPAAGPAQPPPDQARPPQPTTEGQPPPDGVVGAATPGDAILRGLERMSQGFNGQLEKVAEAVNSVKPGEMMSASDLMKLQFSLTQVSIQQDVTGKVVGKATQNLDTFLKNQ